MIQLTNAVDRYGKIILYELKDNNINCWLAGGALRDYFAGLKITTDYDIFFPNEVEYEKAKAFFKEKDCEVKWESDNGMKVVYNKRVFDLVKKFFPTPKIQLMLSTLQYLCLP
jgi:tRNA nucleotidyltransferase/poly(A) polymerase